MIYKKRTVVITGANGFIGRHLIEGIDRNRYRVVCISRTVPQMICRDDVCIDLNMSDYGNISKYVKECDIFIPLAWSGNKKNGLDDETQNEMSYRYNLAAIRNLGVKSGLKRIILTGSHYEYGNDGAPLCEESPANPTCAYGRYKLMLYEEALAFCQSMNIQLAELRLFSIYGKDDSREKFYNACIYNLTNGQPLELSECTQVYSFLHIDDCVNAILRVMDDDGDVSGIYNLCSDTYMQLKSFVERMYEITESKSRVVYGKYENSAKSNHVIMLSRKFSDRFDWHPKMDFKEGVYETMMHYKSGGGGGKNPLTVIISESFDWMRTERQAA